MTRTLEHRSQTPPELVAPRQRELRTLFKLARQFKDGSNYLRGQNQDIPQTYADVLGRPTTWAHGMWISPFFFLRKENVMLSFDFVNLPEGTSRINIELRDGCDKTIDQSRIRYKITRTGKGIKKHYDVVKHTDMVMANVASEADNISADESRKMQHMLDEDKLKSLIDEHREGKTNVRREELLELTRLVSMLKKPHKKIAS